MTDDAQRLRAFEAMLTAVRQDHADILSRMAELRAQGRQKTATYQQLLTNKLQLQFFLAYYERFGLTDDAP